MLRNINNYKKKDYKELFMSVHEVLNYSFYDKNFTASVSL